MKIQRVRVNLESLDNAGGVEITVNVSTHSTVHNVRKRLYWPDWKSLLDVYMDEAKRQLINAMKLTCPHCGHELPSETGDLSGKCPKCNRFILKTR